MGIALAGLAAPPLARAFVIPRRYPSPGGEVPHTREPAQVRAHLRDHNLCSPPSHAGDGLKLLQRRFHRAQTLTDLCAQALDGFIQIVDLRQVLGNEELLVRGEVSLERLLYWFRRGDLKLKSEHRRGPGARQALAGCHGVSI